MPEELHKPRPYGELLDKFRQIARVHYNGKTFDNVLNIFEELSLEDKKDILRGALAIHTMMGSLAVYSPYICDHGVPIPLSNNNANPIAPQVVVVAPNLSPTAAPLVDPVMPPAAPSPPTPASPPSPMVDNLETYNAKQMVNLKTWMVKLMILFIVVTTFGLVYFGAMVPESQSIRFLESLGGFGKILDVLLKT